MIISKDNEKIKYINKLKQKKHRDKENKFLVFGDDLILEAKKHDVIIEVYTSNPNKGGTLVSKELMKQLNYTVTPFDTLAICHKLLEKEPSSLILLLEDVQDPDNVGALLRSASAFNFTTVILSNKSADLYNDKTVRASKGALFDLNIIRTDVISKAEELKSLGYKLYITDVNGSESPKLAAKSVLVLGNEGSGVSTQMKELADESLTIKTSNVESLNVNVAGSILMYEWSKLWE